MTIISAVDALQGRAGNEVSCAQCGKRLRPKRGSRRMRFCCDACRQSSFRAKKWASRYEGPQPLRSIQNNPPDQWPATAILEIEDLAFVVQWECSAGNYLTASYGRRRLSRWCPGRNRPAWSSSWGCRPRAHQGEMMCAGQADATGSAHNLSSSYNPDAALPEPIVS